jgi:hypothetical protein
MAEKKGSKKPDKSSQRKSDAQKKGQKQKNR